MNKPLTKPIVAHQDKDKGKAYRQIRLRKGDSFEIVYIPSKWAILGQTLKIKEGGIWDDGWVVEEVWQEVDESFLDGLRSALKHHAEVSDI